MQTTELSRNRLEWRAPAAITATALLLSLFLIFYSPSLGDVAGLFLVAPIALVFLLVCAVRRQGRSRVAVVLMICFYLLTSWPILRRSETLRTEVRWITASNYWKAKVLQQPSQPVSGMKYVIWGGWGMFAQDTDVYLVFSPDDKLYDHSASNLGGLPCPVWRVQRLEKQWYSVTFYTNEGWDNSGHCGG